MGLSKGMIFSDLHFSKTTLVNTRKMSCVYVYPGKNGYRGTVQRPFATLQANNNDNIVLGEVDKLSI